MTPRVKSILKAGPFAVVGAGFIVLACLSLPYVGILFLLSLFVAASNPNKPSTSPLLMLLLLGSIPLQLGFLGLVAIAAANRRVTPGSRVASSGIIGLAVIVAGVTITILVMNPQGSAILLPVGLVAPVIIFACRFVEKPSTDLEAGLRRDH